jgi:hypothetical protein
MVNVKNRAVNFWGSIRTEYPINDESHILTALDGMCYQRITNEKPQTLFEVFKEIFQTIGKEHYERMMEEDPVISYSIKKSYMLLLKG